MVMREGQRLRRTFKNHEAARAWAARQERQKAIKAELDSGNTLLSRIPHRVVKAMTEADYTPEEVVMGAIPVTNVIGVYFLIRDGKVTYVGKTTDVHLRLSKHRRDGRIFDAYNFIPCGADDIDRMERLYLEAFIPSENFRL